MNILITGGAGYIGSHTAIELLEAGFDLVIVDNYSNSERSVLDKVVQIVGSNDAASSLESHTGRILDIIEGDVGDYDCMCYVFERYEIVAVIHFAGYKAVGESVEKPLMYYQNNLPFQGFTFRKSNELINRSALGFLKFFRDFSA